VIWSQRVSRTNSSWESFLICHSSAMIVMI